MVADNEAVSIASLNTISEPSAISGLTVLRDGNSARLNWTAPANGGSSITDYAVAYQPSGASTWTTLSHAPSTSTTVQIPGIDSNGGFNFRVAAINGVGQAAWVTSSLAAQRPWTGPAIGAQPSRASRQVPTTGGTLEITGSGFETTTAVSINGVELKFDATDPKLIKIQIPAGTGSPDLSFSSTEGSLIYENAFEYVTPKPVIVPETLSFGGRNWSPKSRASILAKLKSQVGYRTATCTIVSGSNAAASGSLKRFCQDLLTNYVFKTVTLVDARTTQKIKDSSYRLKFDLSE